MSASPQRAAEPSPAAPLMAPELAATVDFVRSLGPTYVPTTLRGGVRQFTTAVPAASQPGAGQTAPFQVNCRYTCFSVDPNVLISFAADRARAKSLQRRNATQRDPGAESASSSSDSDESDGEGDSGKPAAAALFPNAPYPVNKIEPRHLTLVEKFEGTSMLIVGRGNLVEGFNTLLANTPAGQRSVGYLPPVVAHYDDVPQYDIKFKSGLIFDITVAAVYPSVCIAPDTYKFCMQPADATAEAASVGSIVTLFDRETDRMLGISSKPKPFRAAALALEEQISEFSTRALLTMSAGETSTVVNFKTGEESVLTLAMVDNTQVNGIFDNARRPTKCLAPTAKRLELASIRREDGKRLMEKNQFLKAEIVYTQAIHLLMVEPPVPVAAVPLPDTLWRLVATLHTNVAVARTKREDHSAAMESCHHALQFAAMSPDPNEASRKPQFLLSKALRLLNNLDRAQKAQEALFATFPGGKEEALRDTAIAQEHDALAAAQAAQVAAAASV